MNQYQEKTPRNSAEIAKVVSTASGLQLVGSTAFRNLRVVNPYGIQDKPTKGSEVLVLPLASGEYLLLGSVQSPVNLSEGELLLQNQAGATIKLKADGSISLNGLLIDQNGQMGEV